MLLYGIFVESLFDLGWQLQLCISHLLQFLSYVANKLDILANKLAVLLKYRTQMKKVTESTV